MNQSPFFSIIIPNYNAGKYINDAITSILNQKFKSWELIVIDGGSTDNRQEARTVQYAWRISNDMPVQ
jgi:glycosyltransferase involved in cell wall biosynthesis